MKAIRWAGKERDRYFGPFTYSRDSKGNRPLAVILGSGDGDDYPGCRLMVRGFGHTFILALPPVVRPFRGQVISQIFGPQEEVCGREYGFSYNGEDGFLQIFFGRQTGDSSTTQDWACFLPWKQWRHVRHSFYGRTGEHVATLPDTGESYLADPGRWERERAIQDAVPVVIFAFADFDNEFLTAETRIEEREWRRGTGWFKWLSVFEKSRIGRSLDIAFPREMGRGKGSWKGGTVGHSIDLLPGELHEAAFRRYCAAHDMTFEKEVVDA